MIQHRKQARIAKERQKYKHMKNKTLIASIICALRGLYYAIKTEKNYKYYFVIALIFLVLNILCNIPFAGHIAYVITAAGVFSSECINTAVEHFVDMVDTTIREEIKIIKDIAAATVVCWGFGFFICEALSIGSTFL